MAWTPRDGGATLPLWTEADPALQLLLNGKPRAQGSLQLVTKKYAKYSDAVVQHRNAMVAAFTSTWRAHPPLEVARIDLAFAFGRPASQLLPVNSKRVHPELRDTAPVHHVDKPDLDKLVRLVFDALTVAEVLTDDCVVTDLTANKYWADLNIAAHTLVRVYAV